MVSLSPSDNTCTGVHMHTPISHKEEGREAVTEQAEGEKMEMKGSRESREETQPLRSVEVDRRGQKVRKARRGDARSSEGEGGGGASCVGAAALGGCFQAAVLIS